jgi:hypothetical protein
MRAPSVTFDDATVRGEQARQMAGHGGLPDALPGSGDRDRRKSKRGASGRIEPEVGADIGQAARKHPAGEREALDRTEHRLVGEIDHDVDRVTRDRRLDVRGQRNAVLLSPAQLLLPADENGCDELVGELDEGVLDDGRVVLAVDDGERPHDRHVRAVTSSSIAPVNFAYSRVSRANETSFTWPWNGCRRQISTRFSSISITL